MTETSQDELPPVTELKKAQRRVLGVLLEKAFTTPEYYPLTLKAVTSGCNQKSNRQPITNYSEEDVYEVLDELRQMGLVGIIHTASGRTERFRHYMRQRFSFSEPQLAILTELLLRGRQQLGELRARASRMVPTDSLDHLREELRSLQAAAYIQTSGSLERRGVEVDHNLYHEREGRTINADRPAESASMPETAVTDATVAASGIATDTSTILASPESADRTSALQTAIEQLRLDNQQLRNELDELKEQMQQLTDQMDQLCSDLGGY